MRSAPKAVVVMDAERMLNVVGQGFDRWLTIPGQVRLSWACVALEPLGARLDKAGSAKGQPWRSLIRRFDLISTVICHSQLLIANELVCNIRIR